MIKKKTTVLRGKKKAGVITPKAKFGMFVVACGVVGFGYWKLTQNRAPVQPVDKDGILGDGGLANDTMDTCQNHGSIAANAAQAHYAQAKDFHEDNPQTSSFMGGALGAGLCCCLAPMMCR